MLQPSSRRLLLDGLRPSGGYRLDRAVGTSYTVDLLALLTAPLAFTFFDWEDEKGRPMADPLALLEAVRRHAQRIHLFCQAGRVKVPAPGQTLLAYLEDSVFEVEAPHKGGVFHPKVWLLRYVATDDGGARSVPAALPIAQPHVSTAHGIRPWFWTAISLNAAMLSASIARWASSFPRSRR